MAYRNHQLWRNVASAIGVADGMAKYKRNIGKSSQQYHVSAW